jgi:hypothetical protein
VLASARFTTFSLASLHLWLATLKDTGRIEIRNNLLEVFHGCVKSLVRVFLHAVHPLFAAAFLDRALAVDTAGVVSGGSFLRDSVAGDHICCGAGFD